MEYVEIERAWGMAAIGDMVTVSHYPVLVDGQYPEGTLQAEQGFDRTPSETMTQTEWLERCGEFGLNPDGSTT